MRKVASVAAGLLILGAMACPARAAGVTAALPDNDTAQKMVNDFAPWISAIIQQRFAVASKIYPLEKYAETQLENSGAAQVFSKVTRIDDTTVSLVGVHILGDHIGTALFTLPTEHGVIAIKVSYYRYGTDTHVGKVEIADKWTEIELLAETVNALPAPVTAVLSSRVQ
ncbi:MAG: hypothetical protein ACTHN5_08665 [Phycisphaerae bacterium]